MVKLAFVQYIDVACYTDKKKVHSQGQNMSREREQGTHYRSQAHHKMQICDVLILLSIPQMALPQGRRNNSLENIWSGSIATLAAIEGEGENFLLRWNRRRRGKIEINSTDEGHTVGGGDVQHDNVVRDDAVPSIGDLDQCLGEELPDGGVPPDPLHHRPPAQLIAW
jgi:hypothetical protein